MSALQKNAHNVKKKPIFFIRVRRFSLRDENMGFFEWNLSFKKHVKNLIHNIRQVRLLPDRYGS